MSQFHGLVGSPASAMTHHTQQLPFTEGQLLLWPFPWTRRLCHWAVATPVCPLMTWRPRRSPHHADCFPIHKVRTEWLTRESHGQGSIYSPEQKQRGWGSWCWVSVEGSLEVSSRGDTSPKPAVTRCWDGRVDFRLEVLPVATGHLHVGRTLSPGISDFLSP